MKYAAALLATVALAGSAPKLSAPAARYYAGKALARNFGSDYTSGYAKRLRCGVRLGRSSRRCRVSWIIGEYCVSSGGSNCRRVFRVR